MKLNFVRLVVILGVLALAAAGYAWLRSRDGGGEQALRTVKLERGPLQAVVAASGTLNAVTTVQVGSQISGQVKEIHADFNTAVKKDQVIARIDPQTFDLRVNQARADLDAAHSAVAVARSGLAAQQAEVGRVKVTLFDAQRDYERKRSLVEKNFISGAELDKARRSMDSISRTIASALRTMVGQRDPIEINWRGAEGRQLAETILTQTLNIFMVPG
jgi:HlyD family secretion protein